MVKRYFGFLVLVAMSSVFLSGCYYTAGTLSHEFKKVEEVSGGMGLVYIYRPPRVLAPTEYSIKVNGERLIALRNGGYYPYLVKAGTVEFSAKMLHLSSVTIDVEPGEIYYLRGTLALGWVPKPRLTVVSPEVGKEEIAKCRFIEK